jgi:uncharacterized protein
MILLSGDVMEKVDIKGVLESAKTIAVVGLSDKDGKTSNRIGKYLKSKGYVVVPVNPNADEVIGEKSYKSLADIPPEIKIDIVNVFRRSEFVEEVANEAVKRGCGTFWAQLGIYSENAAKLLEEANIPFIMNRCIFVEHQNH